MKCEDCVYNHGCRKPNQNKPACLIFARYDKARQLTKIPKRYIGCMMNNLPIEESNPKAYKAIIKYCDAVLDFVKKGTSLYLYSEPTQTNPLGTGTGKTTSACTILNEFLVKYVWEQTLLRTPLITAPAMFVRCSDFQNIYNAQFRNQDNASAEYYYYKNSMKEARLLILDDIAIRSCTEAFLNELYEVINHRDVEMLATIYTSNVPLDKVGELLDYRIESRIRDNCASIKFTGEDHRGF